MRKRRSSYRPSSYNSAPMEKTRYNSWGEFLAAVDDVTEEETRRDFPSTNPYTFSQSFTGVSSPSEAMQLARFGWAEGESKISSFSAPLFDRIASLIEKQIYSYDTEGIDFDIARVIEGEPECWLRQNTIMAESVGRHIRLVFNTSASSAIRADVMTAKGAVIAALVECLEYAGNRVQLDVVTMCAAADVVKYESRVVVKEADQELDMGRIAFAVAHPATLRTLAITEASNPRIHGDLRKRLTESVGIPIETDDKGDIYIASSFYGEPQWKNEESSRAWVIEKLQEQGVKLREE